MWLLFLILFIALWLIELVFGWLDAEHFRSLLTISALVYFGISLKALKTSHAELEREMKRLMSVVKSLQTVAASAKQTQSTQTQAASEKVVDVRVEFPVDETLDNDTSSVIWDNMATVVPQTTVAEPVSTKDITIPAVAENLPPRQDPWVYDDYRKLNQAPSALEDWLAGGNWIVRGGLAILFIGLVFLAKFAYENALLPLELRLAAIAGFAIALLVIGWRAKDNRPTYGLSLQGGGVAALYLTVFATSKLTTFLPPLLVMGLMLLVAVLAAWLAIQQEAMVLAIIGTIGGFMAPVLMSTGQGSHIALFSYFAALNAGILTVALHKAWRPLNVLAFFFSFGIAGLWGMRGYQPEHQLSCLLFLALFFAMFVTVSMLFTKHQTTEGEANRAVDATLLFGVPTATFGYGLYLLKPYEYGGVWLAVLLSAIYLVLAYFAKTSPKLEQLKTPWAALSLLLATLAVPLAFDARLTSSIWVLEGAAVISYGWRQMQPKTRGFGYLLVFLGTLGFFINWPDVAYSVPIFNALTVGLLVLSLAYGVIGWTVNRFNEIDDSSQVSELVDERLTVSWLMAIAMAFTGALSIVTELYFRNSAAIASIAAPALLLLWALALQRISQFANWRQAIAPTIVLPLLTLIMPIYHSFLREGLTTQGLILTVVALLALLIWQALVLKQILPELKRLFEDNIVPVSISALPGFTLVVFWLTLLVRGRNTLSSAIMPESSLTMHGWFVPLISALPVMLLWWLAQPKTASTMTAHSPILWRWLHGDNELADAAVNKQLRVFMLITLMFICTTALFHSGQATYGLTYIPLLNLYELIAIAGLLALLRLFRNTDIGETMLGQNRRKFLSVLAFVFANSILSRILVNFFGADFGFGFAWHSAIAATTYSIVWTFTALVMMWLASSRMKRGLWITGAVLLGIVAIKLLMIDLSKVGSLARIISFIGVGVLMLVVGFVAPIPTENKRSVN